MTDANLTVADDLVVGLNYTLRLDDGEVVDASSDREPLEFLQGKGQIVVGLERELYGMAIGDQKNVVVTAVDGYGEADPKSFETVPRDVFPAELELSPGMRLNMRDRSGEVFTTYVAEVKSDSVLLDFNHPLAGETLHFDVKVASLRHATDEEMEHGHAHEE